MQSNRPDTDIHELDTKILFKVLYTLNITRHHVVSYPSNHPIIETSATQLLSLLAQLLKLTDRIALGIARDVILVGGDVFERGNAVFRDLANGLFESGVVSLVFNQQVCLPEIVLFCQALGRKREDLIAQGGVSGILARAGVRGIEAKGIDYSAFHSTEMVRIQVAAGAGPEEPGSGLWEHFVGGLMDGTLDTSGSGYVGMDSLDPQAVAEALNRRSYRDEPDERNRPASYESNIVSFMKKLDNEEIESHFRKETLEKLGVFIGKLSPEVRKQFLSSAFRSLAARKDLVEEILANLQKETLLDVFTQIENQQIVVPQAIMTLLGQMSHQRKGDEHLRDVAAARRVSDDEIHNRLKILFREESGDQFIPDSYRESLQSVAATMPGALPQSRRIEELKGSLSTHFVENQVCAIILELIETIDPDEDQARSLSRNLMDLLIYFLETGDYRALAQAHQRLLGFDRESSPFTLPIANEALVFFSSPAIIDEVLAGLDLWGKEKHEGIRALMRQVGAPFVEPLLDRLAEEQGLTMRRFYMACLGDLKHTASQAIQVRLHDRRWYVVRNLVVLLRQINDPEVLTSIGYLVGRSHPKVHLEVLKTYLHFKDPRADRYLVKELENSDMERKLNAVRLCGVSRSPEVIRELTRILDHRGKTEDIFELKRAVLKALAEIGSPAALPAIEDVINTRALWSPVLLNRLKVEAVRSLVHYRDQRAEELLRRIAGGKGDLARLAETALLRGGEGQK
ncbi:MAG: hypothetical protein A2X84_03965 [Desulfuromonadaceae bacterium GWC2_58_13]|nr:MAG: hypothetical protein A2X84_03965 [Desulfuromonadaceae bacterium GWC2_58_13]